MSEGQITSALSLIDGFRSFDERLQEERPLRIEAGKDVVPFGVSFLDDALGGIYKNDLIVLGARSGVGKTQISMLMAVSASQAGKRVAYLALESDAYELERRIKYQALSEKFYQDLQRPKNIWLNYSDWYYGKLDHELDAYEQSIDQELKRPLLNIYYRQNEFTEKDFERIYLSIKSEVDVVVIDHLHYFDFTDENENRAVKSIVKKIRDLTLIVGKPVILVSHIRKTDKRLKQIIPDLEDFHGSSDIGKIATKAFVIAPDFGAPMTPGTRSTYIAILKSRVDGSRTRAVGLMNFNLNKQKYESGYVLGHLNADQSTFTKTEAVDLPKWAIHCRNERSKESKGFHYE